MRSERGYSLIELVVTISIVAVLAGIGTQMMTIPLRSFSEATRRAELTDAAAVALVRMARDVRAALPNSIRAGGGSALELLSVVDGERYRADPPGSPSDRLTIGASDSLFNTFASLGVVGTYAAHRLAIYPLGQSGANPYTDTVLTPAMNISIAATASPGGGGTDGEFRVTMGTAHSFPFDSPAQRVFLVSGPVSYFCSGGQLVRHSGYAVSATQPATGAATGVTGTLITDNLESCSFTYDVANARRGLVTMVLVMASTSALGGAPERVRMVRQVHVDNSP